MRDETDVNVICERELLALSSAKLLNHDSKGPKTSNPVAFICYSRGKNSVSFNLGNYTLFDHPHSELNPA